MRRHLLPSTARFGIAGPTTGGLEPRPAGTGNPGIQRAADLTETLLRGPALTSFSEFAVFSQYLRKDAGWPCLPRGKFLAAVWDFRALRKRIQI